MPAPQAYAVSSHATQRAVIGMTIGTIRANLERRAEDWKDALDEYDAQFIIPFAGDCASKLVWADVALSFSVGFVDEPNRHTPDRADGKYTPLFTYGVEHTAGEWTMVTCQVKKWGDPTGGAMVPRPAPGAQWLDQEVGLTAVTLRIGIFNPAIVKAVHTEGLIHANFQGYASPIYEEDGATDG